MLNANIQGLLEDLRRRGWYAYVAGGAARDGMLGIEPKDYDIVLIGRPRGNCTDKDHMFWDLIESGATNLNMWDDGDIEYLTDEGEGRIEWVISGQIDGFKFDVIQYRDEPESIEEQLEMFDCNLNFFYYSECGQGVEEIPGAWQPGEEVKFTRYCDGNVLDRLTYLRTKFPLIQFPSYHVAYSQVKDGI